MYWISGLLKYPAGYRIAFSDIRPDTGKENRRIYGCLEDGVIIIIRKISNTNYL
jgi:hypothetical protein